MATRRRQVTSELIFHSDRGSQYASWWFRDVLVGDEVRPSMSGKGDCYDNAVVESFFGTLKTECFAGRMPETRTEAANRLLYYIEAYYNHSSHYAFVRCA